MAQTLFIPDLSFFKMIFKTVQIDQLARNHGSKLRKTKKNDNDSYEPLVEADFNEEKFQSLIDVFKNGAPHQPNDILHNISEAIRRIVAEHIIPKDGNKRMGFFVADRYLHENNFRCNCSEKIFMNFLERVAADKNSFDYIFRWFRDHFEPYNMN